MEIIYPLLGAGIGILLLAAGVGIGVAVRRCREIDALPLLQRMSTNYAAQLTESATLANAAKELSEVCRQHEPPLPGKILSGADNVLRASTSLQQQVKSLSQLISAFQQFQGKTEAAMRSEELGLRLAARTAQERKLLQDKSSQKRESAPQKLTFDLWQYVAPYDGMNYPAAASFELVHCTGSSSEGFSFFSKNPPRTTRLIVAVGSPSSLQFHVAEALQSRPLTIDGEQGQLTACLFVQKLAGVYQWEANQCRIAQKSQAVTA